MTGPAAVSGPPPAAPPLPLRPYVALSTAAILLNVALYGFFVDGRGFLVVAFSAAVTFSISLILAFPVAGGAALLDRILRWKKLDRLLASRPRLRPALVLGAAAAGFTLVHLILYFDRFIYRLYSYHLNGFVWNLLTTRGGIEALGSGAATKRSFLLIVLGFAAMQGGLLALLVRRPGIGDRIAKALPRRVRIGIATAFVLAVLFDKAVYGLSRYKVYGPVLEAAEAYPLHIPVAFSALARRMGFEEGKAGPGFRMESTTRRLRYPLQPLRRDPAAPRLNVVWLAAESWRWDMLDPSIMPATRAFAEESARFTRHYSGGNGTRMGIFTMFTGLYGPYWFPFFAEQRGAVLIDLLMAEGYQLDLSTSAMFSYPEFDRTIFARVPREKLHESKSGAGWERDRANVTRLLDVIDRRDPSAPFMTFMFFESPHGPYEFPEECAIRKPYPAELNYLAMDLKKDIVPIKNRYMNACNHLDTQFARIVDHLRKKGLLESTIVIMTGDHGEEFMEKGRWGHASTFSEEQVRVPLLIHVPGRSPERVDRMTSHLDLAPTVMRLLGVSNPPEDYCLGIDLFGPGGRDFTIFSGWEHIAYGDGRWKADLPLKTWDIVHRKVTTMDDGPAPDAGEFYSKKREDLLRVLRDLGRFLE